MPFPRTSGVLLHVTSLPGQFGIGDLGPGAYRFADFLADAGQGLWQVLPLVPVGYGYSPYSSPSTFAGNPLLISPDRLLSRGLLHENDVAEAPLFSEFTVQFERVIPFKHRLLEQAFERFERGEGDVDRHAFETFCERQSAWLEDYVLFVTLKDEHGEKDWMDWPAPLRFREDEALARCRVEYARKLQMHRFWQFLFAQQWSELKTYCNDRDIRIFGDLPIYVAADSADVWANPELFQLDDDNQPTSVAGVPPDYFSETGQRWGNPLYRWDAMRQNGYTWWKRRLEAMLSQVDLVRLDHFRAFQAYWSVPAHEPTAVNGDWVDGPGTHFFQKLERYFGSPLPIVAEDLGLITEDVHHLMNQFDLPGMAVLQFAFDEEPDHPFLPHNHRRNLVAYTGTHDNDTIMGWWNDLPQGLDAERQARPFARRYLGLDDGGTDDVHWAFVRVLMQSVANRVVVPMQDLLGLGSESRMNVPGHAAGNWTWRMADGSLTPHVADRLRVLTETYGRATEQAGRHRHRIGVVSPSAQQT